MLLQSPFETLMPLFAAGVDARDPDRDDVEIALSALAGGDPERQMRIFDCVSSIRYARCGHEPGGPVIVPASGRVFILTLAFADVRSETMVLMRKGRSDDLVDGFHPEGLDDRLRAVREDGPFASHFTQTACDHLTEHVFTVLATLTGGHRHAGGLTIALDDLDCVRAAGDLPFFRALLLASHVEVCNA